MKLHEIFNEVVLTELGPDMNDPHSVDEWTTRYKRIIQSSDSPTERNMAERLLTKLNSDILHDKFYKDLTKKDKPESWATKLGRGLGKFASSFVHEQLLTELGPDLKDRRSVEEWIARYKRIIEESNGVGEREMAAKLLAKLYADLGRKPDPEPEQPKAKPTGTDVSTNAFQVVFFGHFYDPMAGKRGSDKVWGWGVYGDFIFQFWGPNGKTPGVKRLPNTPENRQKLNDLAFKKERKGYDKIKASNHVEWLKRVLDTQPRFDG